MNKPTVSIWTDGACKGNPGPGGWGVLLIHKENKKELYGGEALTTNNRMEMMAVIQALSALKKPCSVNLYVDSVYVKKGLTEWMPNWLKNNWRTASKKPVKNADLWQELNHLCSQHDINWYWVKGHSGDPGNEKADELANKGVESILSTS